MVERIKREWFSNIRADILSGIVVALALIPEAIAFSIIAGVNPMVGLYASFCIAVIVAIAGGRPAMISAATGAMALVLAPLVRDYGVNYMLAATVLTGIIQIIFGICKIAKLMRFIPRAVMIGFVNSLSILVFMAQMPHFMNVTNITYVFAAITIILLIVLPRFIKAIPAPLIATIVLTIAAIMMSVDVRTVGDLGTIEKSLPSFSLPNVPLNLETFMIILPFSISLAIVGLIESLLTASILDDMTETKSDKNREAKGQGLANIVTGFFGGMAGCAMIGQSIINVKSGGRGRLSTFIAGAFLMFLIIVLGDWVVQIPMAVLAGIMVMVAITSFDWSTFSYMKKAPISETFVMLLTVSIVVVTHNLAIGVISGVIISSLFFVAKVSKIIVEQHSENGAEVYTVRGPLFFASVEGFLSSFDFSKKEEDIIIDFSQTTIWDDSAVGAIDKVVMKLTENKNKVTVTGLNKSSKRIVDQLTDMNISVH
ncbi:SulP family inorganic anion transporter [Bacillus sp. AGMB 02131]|uniref:SulP family inorganic anion transporter n=1 Tax=Peribacillus faecalis TaxID=2772559 RepID=A0A927CXG0_9BACI|nr:SulP family inorganic anion transporter [Peribacillus faecalis]MBD3107740.1 SulP family inorganic anion transporter [Peribacillus faecalis]